MDGAEVCHAMVGTDGVPAVANIDLRVGGKYLSAMRSPDGRDFWSTVFTARLFPGADCGHR